MKKIFILFFLFTNTVTFAQFNVQSSGSSISNNHIFQFNSIVYPASRLGLILTNISSTEIINIKIRVESITNTNGSQMQICTGAQCVLGIQVGNLYPETGSITINPGQSSAENDIYLINEYAGGTSFPIDYRFKIFQIDGSGTEIGTPFYFTYRYDPNTAGIANHTLQNYKVFPTMSSNIINIESEEAVSVSVLDMQGRMLMNSYFKLSHQLDISNLSPQTYLLEIVNSQGARAINRIIKL